MAGATSAYRQRSSTTRGRGAAVWSSLLILLAFATFFNIYTYCSQHKAVGVSNRATTEQESALTAGGDRASSHDTERRGDVEKAVLYGDHRLGGRESISQDQSVGDNPDQDKSAQLSDNYPEQRLLPLGRDHPLQVVPPRASLGELRSFPCSLTEENEYSAFDGSRIASNDIQNRNAGKAWASSDKCVISCSTEEGGPRVDIESDRDVLDGGRREAGFEGRDVEEKDRNVCERGIRACELFQECTHIVIDAPGNGNGHGDEAGRTPETSSPLFATLWHMPREDASLVAVLAAADARAAGRGFKGGWAAAGGFTLEERPRTYYVVSFGGSGSKMLGGWLSERGKGMVKEVFHLHDPEPAQTLFAMQAKRGVSAGRGGKGKDFRGYGFPEGSFPSEGTKVKDVDSYRVVLIFKDPAEALVSRYFYNHCKNLRGADCGGSEKNFPSFERYAEETGDRLNMEAFYNNYCGSSEKEKNLARLQKNYPVVCINYHKIWDNKVAVVRALGLPEPEAHKLPTRTETVRNDHTSAARGESFTLAVREKLRHKHAALSEKVFEAPAVSIV